MKYTVKTYSDWMHPYFYSEGDTRLVREKILNEQETDDADLAVTMVKDWLGVPDKEMTDQDVRIDFDTDERKLADEYVKQIKDYYNGRLAIFRKFEAEFKNNKLGDILKYDIPYDLNHFETSPFDFTGLETQYDTYFSVTVEK